MMLTRETTAGHDFAHDSKVLGREKVAHIWPAAGGLASGRPIFVLLHPFGGNRTSWARHAPDLMATLARDFVVVLPECGRGWFINDHAGKRYEDYLIGELIPLVRETYARGRPGLHRRVFHGRGVGLFSRSETSRCVRRGVCRGGSVHGGKSHGRSLRGDPLGRAADPD